MSLLPLKNPSFAEHVLKRVLALAHTSKYPEASKHVQKLLWQKDAVRQHAWLVCALPTHLCVCGPPGWPQRAVSCCCVWLLCKRNLRDRCAV